MLRQTFVNSFPSWADWLISEYLPAKLISEYLPARL